MSARALYRSSSTPTSSSFSTPSSSGSARYKPLQEFNSGGYAESAYDPRMNLFSEDGFALGSYSPFSLKRNISSPRPSPPAKRTKRGCTYSRNETWKRCRSKAQHERYVSGKEGRRKKGCTYSRDEKSKRCRSKMQHESWLSRGKRQKVKR